MTPSISSPFSLLNDFAMKLTGVFAHSYLERRE
jgi:hypothetical protein